MPKMKTRSTAKKRFKKLSSGLIKKGQCFRRHLLTKKSGKTKRQLRNSAYVHGSESYKLVQLLNGQ